MGDGWGRDIVASALALAQLEAALLAGPIESDQDGRAYELGRALCQALGAAPPHTATPPLEHSVLPGTSEPRAADAAAYLWQQQLIAALARACAEPDLHRRLRLRARALVRTLRLLDSLSDETTVPPEALAQACALYNHLDMVCRGQRAATTLPEARSQARPLLDALRCA